MKFQLFTSNKQNVRVQIANARTSKKQNTEFIMGQFKLLSRNKISPPVKLYHL